jgi:hypothetical protein
MPHLLGHAAPVYHGPRHRPPDRARLNPASRQSALAVRCTTNVRSVMLAWLAYAGDHDDLLAPRGDGEAWPGPHEGLIYYQRAPGDANIDLEHGALMDALGDSPAARAPLLACPLATGPEDPNVSYVFTADLRPDLGPRRLHQVVLPAVRLPLIEQERPDEDGNFDPDDADDLGCSRHSRRSADRSPADAPSSDAAPAATAGKGAAAWADGHAALLAPADLRRHPEWLRIFR